MKSAWSVYHREHRGPPSFCFEAWRMIVPKGRGNKAKGKSAKLMQPWIPALLISPLSPSPNVGETENVHSPHRPASGQGALMTPLHHLNPIITGTNVASIASPALGLWIIGKSAR